MIDDPSARPAAAVVFVCGRDSTLVAPFARRWQALAPDWPLWLAVDRGDLIPPDICPHLPRLESLWSEGGIRRAENVLACLAAAAAAERCPWALKLDVDVLHLSVEWLQSALAAGDYDGIGQTRPDAPGCWSGAVYAVRADLLPAMRAWLASMGRWDRATARAEDIATARALLGAGGALTLPIRLAGWQAQWTPPALPAILSSWPTLSTLHLGQLGGRHHAAAVLQSYPLP